MNFKEYCSSYITPQMTLLQKFNALLKYIEDSQITNMIKAYRVNVSVSNQLYSSFVLFSSHKIETRQDIEKYVETFVYGYILDDADNQCAINRFFINSINKKLTVGYYDINSQQNMTLSYGSDSNFEIIELGEI